MRVSVAYVEPGTTFWQVLEEDEGCNILYAINHSGLLAKVPSIDLVILKVGIFGKVAKLDTLLKEGIGWRSIVPSPRRRMMTTTMSDPVTSPLRLLVH